VSCAYKWMNSTPILFTLTCTCFCVTLVLVCLLSSQRYFCNSILFLPFHDYFNTPGVTMAMTHLCTNDCDHMWKRIEEKSIKPWNHGLTKRTEWQGFQPHQWNNGHLEPRRLNPKRAPMSTRLPSPGLVVKSTKFPKHDLSS
jgi:hypothetical protein